MVAFFWAAVHRNAANGTAAASSHTWAVGFEGASPSMHTATRFANGRSMNWPSRRSERASRSARNAGATRSNPISGWW